MKGSWLTSFWVVTGYNWGPFGLGVTAWSVEDAIQLLRSHRFDIPDDLNEIQIQENVTFADLDRNNVIPNMGPMIMRGVWYPCLNLGFLPRYFGTRRFVD